MFRKKKIRSTNDKKKARNEFVYYIKRNKGTSAFGRDDFDMSSLEGPGCIVMEDCLVRSIAGHHTYI